MLLYRRSTLTVLLALIFLSFFGTLAVIARLFPQGYDWRYRVISNLLSPRDNPAHHWFAACGVALTAVLILPFAGYLRRNLGVISSMGARGSAGSFIAGCIVLISACFVAPQHKHDVWGIRRLHELLGRSAAGLLAIGMLSACWCAWKGWLNDKSFAFLFWTWSSLTVLPLSGIFLSECLLLLTRLNPMWAAPIRNTLRHSIFWHLGFWEWTGAAAVFLFLCAAVFLMPQRAASFPNGRTEELLSCRGVKRPD